LAISAPKHELEKKQNSAMAKVTDEFNWDSAGNSLISQLEKAAYDNRQWFTGKKPETGRQG
jgi:flagellar biosynthesis chaperone FliJ